MAIATFPKFAGTGMTSSLLDNEIVILGDDNLGTKGRHISVQNPRDGLLAMKYTIQNIPLRQSPQQHSSLVSRNTLTVVGGKFKSRGKFSKFTWTELSLKWENGTNFIASFIDACSVKVGVDMHIIFGRDVMKINTTEEIVYKLKPMTHSRVSHDCQLLSTSLVLVSGGLAQRGANPSRILPDELYNITATGEVVKVLDLEQSLRRTHHRLIVIKDRIWALGGKNSDNNVPSKIEEFDPTTNSWNDLKQELQSSNTTELIATPFPASSLDCIPKCHCGIPKNNKERISGGNEAGVNLFSSLYL